MNPYVKSFLHRGMLFGGFGPIIAAIVFAILGCTLPDFSLTGGQVFSAVVSTYILAFIQAGVSVFNQIEHWSVGKSLFCHLTVLYLAYAACYILNFWIPFEPMVLVIFTVIFVVCYFVVWLTVYFSVRAAAKRLNRKLG
ncbi:MAG: DUF3021 domain-containing protein [Ruminococcaceae bacterium]|nr:DUF3021 domain-containing protein [Oscillospiraceae bacterium]